MKSNCFASVSLCFALLTLGSVATAAETVLVDLVTSEGEIRVELDAEKAPKTVKNFVSYVESGHYNGTVFHRVIPSFMIQGGGMTEDLREKKTEPPVVNEAGNGLKNLKYTLAMARTSNPNSATSQFFINVADNAFLDRANSQDGFGYAVFGKVVAGKEVVDKIAAKKTAVKADPVNRIPMEDVPVEAVTIISAKLVVAE
jgi:cyclophilin family peptidyl-prolyl cis-trans isomerase